MNILTLFNVQCKRDEFRSRISDDFTLFPFCNLFSSLSFQLLQSPICVGLLSDIFADKTRPQRWFNKFLAWFLSEYYLTSAETVYCVLSSLVNTFRYFAFFNILTHKSVSFSQDSINAPSISNSTSGETNLRFR